MMEVKITLLPFKKKKMVESFAQYYFVLFSGGEICFAFYPEAGFSVHILFGGLVAGGDMP